MTLFKFFGPIVLFLLYKIQGHRGAPGLGQMTCDQASRASFSLNNANLHSHQNLFQLTRPTTQYPPQCEISGYSLAYGLATQCLKFLGIPGNSGYAGYPILEFLSY